jgi:thiamine biosynthesis lipoprotein
MFPTTIGSLTACVLVPLFSVLVACGQNLVATLEILGNTMGTRYSIQIPVVGDLPDPGLLKLQIEEDLQHIDQIMSTYREDSQLSRFNQNRSSDWFPVAIELAQVVAAAKSLHVQTGGAFDASVGPLVNLWGFGSVGEYPELPNAAQIEEAKARLGMHTLQVRMQPQPALLKKRGDVYLDLSAIAKGYAVDRIAVLLERRSIWNYLVEIGGEIRVRGVNASGESWRIAIESPNLGVHTVQQVFPLDRGGVATSGSYRNYRTHQGVSYSHAIDPATGRPVEHKLLSVTVVSETAMHADGLATALLVMGPETGVQWATGQGLDALFTVAVGSRIVQRSSGRFINWLDKP